MNNRLGNALNPYQGNWPRVLCVCSAGLLRSPTIAWVLSNPPYNCNTRAAGVTAEYALVPVDECLLTWAQRIVCASPEHAEIIDERLKEFELEERIVHRLNIPDDYRTRDPELIRKIGVELDRIGFPKVI